MFKFILALALAPAYLSAADPFSEAASEAKKKEQAEEQERLVAEMNALEAPPHLTWAQAYD